MNRIVDLKEKRVLVVDDVEINRYVISGLLSKEGATVDTADDGEKALAAVKLHRYDFVLMDIVMPGMNGFIAAMKLRTMGYDSLPVFAITSLTDSEIEERAAEAGMNGVLMKPLVISELYAMLEKTVRKPASNYSGSAPWLKLMYITNRPDVALIAEKNGVDRIWIDLETIGKAERQPGNTVKSHHSIDDIRRIRPLLTKSEMLVRVEPWNENSRKEIDAVISAGADIVMLPMWRNVREAESFLEAVGGRVKTMLLLETRGAVECLDGVLALRPDEIHIGLNDLHIDYGLDFMFELLSNGCVEELCNKIRASGIPYGFGGIARIGHGTLRSEKIIMEHRRLGSTRTILSRSFCDANTCNDTARIEALFESSMKAIFAFEEVCAKCGEDTFEKNRLEVAQAVSEIVMAMKEKNRYDA